METIERNGRTYRVWTEQDTAHGAPWEECDGHGIVSDWTTRAKLPGEMILAQDRGQYRYYDFAASVRIARADKWDAEPFNKGQETKGQQAAKAAMADYEYLRQWCNDVWSYAVVFVQAECPHCGELSGDYACLGGVEDSSPEHVSEVAEELIYELTPSIAA